MTLVSFPKFALLLRTVFLHSERTLKSLLSVVALVAIGCILQAKKTHHEHFKYIVYYLFIILKSKP
jgi:hypothetical protein